jgi:tetratricopeptide (TPR) repeat protein
MKCSFKKRVAVLLVVLTGCIHLHAQKFADRKFYIIDSLDLSNVTAEQRKLIDSCLTVYHKTKNDSSALIALMHIVDQCWDDKVWPRYNEWVLEETKRRLALPGKTGKEYLFYYKKTYALALNNKGFFYNKHGDFASALGQWELSLQIQEAVGDKRGSANSLNNIASVYENLGNIPRAIEYYHKSLKIKEELKDKKGMGTTLNNMGNIYINQGEVEKATEYWQRSLVLRRECNDKVGEAISLSNLAGTFENKKNFRKALDYYFTALEIIHATGNKAIEATCLRNIARTYETLAIRTENKKSAAVFFDSALCFVKRSLSLREEVADKKGISASLSNMGFIYSDLKNYNEAERCGVKALEIARQIKTPGNIREAARLLYAVYKATNKNREALEMFELSVLMRDSVMNLENKKASIKNQLKYEYEKKSAADSVKNAEEQKVKDAQLTAQSAKLKQEKTQFWFLVGGLLFVVVGLSFVVHRFRITQKQKKIIEAQKIQVDTAFEKLHEKNKEVLDSIYYARRIQRALLTQEKYFSKSLKRLQNTLK